MAVDNGSSRSARGTSVLRGSFSGGSCALVPLDFVHTENVVAWRNDPAISRWFLSERRFEKNAHEAWLTRTLQLDSDFNWVIQDPHSLPIGTVALYDVDWSTGVAEFGRLMVGAQEARGKGFARAATLLVLDAASAAGLNELRLEVKMSNIPALSLYESAGFVEVGRSDVCIKMIKSINAK